MSDALIAMIAALAGAVIGYFTGKQFGFGVGRHNFDIHIHHDDRQGYYSKTTPAKQKVLGGDFVYWKVTQMKKLPVGSVIELRFPGGSCLIDDTPGDGGHGDKIQNFVKYFQVKKSYAYKIYYIDSTGDHLLEDPELIIEGDNSFKSR